MSNVTAAELAARYTVAQLRDLIQTEGGDLTGTSKYTKARLAERLANLRAIASVSGPMPKATFGEVETEEDANTMLAGALYMASTQNTPEFSVEDQRQLNHAKYLGRYHAKRVQVRSMGRHVAGRVIENVLRERDLLLVVQHQDATTRTLHAAADVVLV